MTFSTPTKMCHTQGDMNLSVSVGIGGCGSAHACMVENMSTHTYMLIHTCMHMLFAHAHPCNGTHSFVAWTRLGFWYEKQTVECARQF